MSTMVCHFQMITDSFLKINFPIGLQLAMLADFPKDLIDKGSQVAQNLDELYSQSSDHSSSSKIIAQRQALLRVCWLSFIFFDVS